MIPAKNQMSPQPCDGNSDVNRNPMADRPQSRNEGTSGWRRVAALAILSFGLMSATVAAAELKQDTIQAFERYMKVTEEDRDARLRRSAAFLWIDRQPEARRQSLY